MSSVFVVTIETTTQEDKLYAIAATFQIAEYFEAEALEIPWVETATITEQPCHTEEPWR